MYFKNYISFGVNWDETVWANCFGIRLFDIFSIGWTVKKFDSRRTFGFNGSIGIAQGHAFDIGIRINKKFDFFDLFYINPAFGISALNMGGDSVEYKHSTSGSKKPLPRWGIIGVSCDINALALIGYTYIYELSYDLLEKPKDKIVHIGHKLQITPFYAILWGTMDDKAGGRYEKNKGYTFEFNFIKVIYLVSKFVKLIDILNYTNRYDNFVKWNEIVLKSGLKFKPNVYYSKSYSVIYGEKTSPARHLQTRDDWSFGIGVIGEFPNFFTMNERSEGEGGSKSDEETKKNENNNENDSDSIIIEEEDGEFIE